MNCSLSCLAVQEAYNFIQCLEGGAFLDGEVNAELLRHELGQSNYIQRGYAGFGKADVQVIWNVQGLTVHLDVVVDQTYESFCSGCH